VEIIVIASESGKSEKRVKKNKCTLLQLATTEACREQGLLAFYVTKPLTFAASLPLFPISLDPFSIVEILYLMAPLPSLRNPLRITIFYQT